MVQLKSTVSIKLQCPCDNGVTFINAWAWLLRWSWMAYRFTPLSRVSTAALYLPPVAPNECVNLNCAQLQHGVRELTWLHWLELTWVALGTGRACSCALYASGINTRPAQTGPLSANTGKGGTPGELTVWVAMAAAEAFFSHIHTNTRHTNKLAIKARRDTRNGSKLRLD